MSALYYNTKKPLLLYNCIIIIVWYHENWTFYFKAVDQYKVVIIINTNVKIN